MNIKFIGPAIKLPDDGVGFLVKLDGNDIQCKFSYEVLEDIDPDNIFGDPIVHFSKHQLKLLSIAEQKMLNGHTHNGILQITSSDLQLD